VNLIFDLGGVVVRWDPDAIIAGVFSDPGLRARAKADVLAHPDWLDVDRGTLAVDEGIRRAARRTGLAHDEVARLFAAVPPSLVPFPETVALLYRLKARGYPLYCLSNMGFASIERLEREQRFFEVFSGVVVSCRLRLCKPEPAIYQHALSTYGLKAQDTVFIDDVEKNVAAAAQLGIHPIQFRNVAQLERELRALGVNP
jgi:putative hydrolase of the HAD superfamily